MNKQLWLLPWWVFFCKAGLILLDFLPFFLIFGFGAFFVSLATEDKTSPSQYQIFDKEKNATYIVDHMVYIGGCVEFKITPEDEEMSRLCRDFKVEPYPLKEEQNE
jgi:hypothetical protein